MTDEQYISAQEAATRKGVAVPTIYAAVRRGEIPAYRFMGRVALLPADVDAFQPASYGENQRTKKPRGPGRPRKQAINPVVSDTTENGETGQG